ncbi:MAG: ester cyclase [Deltaproteobacteria bacterium]|nr:ester cyclase [Deltaproteobacteria bacterium]
MKPALLLLVLALLPACEAMKRSALESAMHDIWVEGNLDRIDGAYEPELAWEIKQFVADNRALYPDITLTIDDAIIKNNRYVTVWTISGTHRDLDKRVTLSGVSVRTRVDGKIVEETMFYDVKAIYDQLGFTVVPPPELSPFDPVTPVVSRGEEAPAAEEETSPEEGAGEEAPEGTEEAPAEEAPEGTEETPEGTEEAPAED